MTGICASLAIYGVVFARQQPPLHGVERGSRKARQRKGLGVRVLSCMIGSTVHAPKFLAAASSLVEGHRDVSLARQPV